MNNILISSTHKTPGSSDIYLINKNMHKASKALKSNKELTFTDEEIDMFLPKELKKRTI